MRATDVLRAHHEEIRSLFKRLDGAAEDEQGGVFEELATDLIAHDLIEREIFYPALEEAPQMLELIAQARAEHDVMEFCVYRADSGQAEEDSFESKCDVLKEAALHHLNEEERLIFPKAEKYLDREKLEKMGNQLSERFEEVSEDDFRITLEDMLGQSLKGIVQSLAAKGKRKAARPRAAR